MNKKLVVYTCIINPVEPFGIYENYDSLKTNVSEKNVDYICFTNNPELKSSQHKIVHIDIENDDPKKTQRKYKVLPHLFLKDYEYSLYIDGHISIKKPIYEKAMKLFNNGNFICRNHPKRNCIYEEAKVVIKIKKEKENIVNNQIKRYREVNFPKNYGLTAAGVMFRKHNEKDVINTLNTWWEEISENSYRDQLSFMYSVWKNKSKINLFDENFFKKYFNMGHHRIKNGIIRKKY